MLCRKPRDFHSASEDHDVVGDRQEKHFTTLQPRAPRRKCMGKVAFNHAENGLNLPALAETNASAGCCGCEVLLHQSTIRDSSPAWPKAGHDTDTAECNSECCGQSAGAQGWHDGQIPPRATSGEDESVAGE